MHSSIVQNFKTMRKTSARKKLITLKKTVVPNFYDRGNLVQQ